MLTDAPHQLLFPRGAVWHQELRMEHLHFLFRQYLTQLLRHLLRFAHRIDDDARAAASLHFLA